MDVMFTKECASHLGYTSARPLVQMLRCIQHSMRPGHHHPPTVIFSWKTTTDLKKTFHDIIVQFLKKSVVYDSFSRFSWCFMALVSRNNWLTSGWLHRRTAAQLGFPRRGNHLVHPKKRVIFQGTLEDQRPKTPRTAIGVEIETHLRTVWRPVRMQVTGWFVYQVAIVVTLHSTFMDFCGMKNYSYIYIADKIIYMPIICSAYRPWFYPQFSGLFWSLLPDKN